MKKKKKNTKEKLNFLSINDLMLLYNFVRKGHSCLIFLSENYASNLTLLSIFFLCEMDWKKYLPLKNLAQLPSK